MFEEGGKTEGLIMVGEVGGRVEEEGVDWNIDSEDTHQIPNQSLA